MDLTYSVSLLLFCLLLLVSLLFSLSLSLSLSLKVLFNLASQYHTNRLYNEALNTYLLIVKNKLFGSGGRLRINMGNIYFEQKKYPLAIKNYRMALDQIPDTHRTVRLVFIDPSH